MSLVRVVRAVRPARALVLVAALTPVACEGDGPRERDGESWPMTVEAPAVLGYLAARAEPERLASWIGEQVGWTPAGLSGARPACALVLDASVMGGDTALCLPVDDEDAFRASLAESPRITSTSGDRYELHLDPDHPLVLAQRTLRSAGESGMAGAIRSALERPQEYVVPVNLAFHDGFALLVPTYEASVITRRALDELAGLWRDEPSTLVVSFDVQRLAQTYHKEIEAVAAQWRAAQFGAGAAGAAAMFAGSRGAMPELPVSGAFLWECVRMLRLDEFAALQYRLDDAGGAFAALDGVLDGLLIESDPPAAIARAASRGPVEDDLDAVSSLRLRWTPGSDWRALVEALRPAPELEGAQFVLSVDGERFADALARFVRPIAEFVRGEGAPADRYASQLGELLRPWSGLFAVFRDGHASSDDSAIVPALSLRPGVAFDVDGARAWLKSLAEAASWKGESFWEVDPAALAEQGGMRLLALDGALVLAPSDATGRVEDAARAVQQAAGAWAPEGGPALRAGDDGAGRPTVEARADGGDLVLRISGLAGPH